MPEVKPFVGQFIRLALGALAFLSAGGARGQLSLFTTVQYPQVIQGATNTVNAFVFNNAPFGSPSQPYVLTAAYGQGFTTGYPTRFTGTQPANGGTVSSLAAPFSFNTATFAPGVVPVAVTLSNAVRGGATATQNSQFTVLAHARPSLVLGSGAPISLSSSSVVTFQTKVANIFGEAAPAGTEAAGGGYAPQMLGDPPGEPTAKLDIDSITSFGSRNITTTLTPIDNLLSTDTPGTGEFFNIFVQQSPGASYDADFNTTFVVHYSDEQDLPGADAPGSQEGAFNVNVDIDGDIANWTITTDASVPDETSSARLLAVILLTCLGARRFFPRRCTNAR